MNPLTSPEYYKVFSAMILRDHQLKIKFVPYITNELINMGFSLNTSNMNEASTIPYNEDLKVFAKYGINRVREIINTTFAEFGDTSLQALRKMFSPDQMIDVFIEKAQNVRHLKREHMLLLDKYNSDENSFKQLTDLPDDIYEIMWEYKVSKRFKLSIPEFENLTNLEYLGCLVTSKEMRNSVNWKEDSLEMKKSRLEGQAINYLTNVTINITSPNESIKFHEQKYITAVKHDSLITTAKQCNVVVVDVVDIASKKYARAGATFIQRAKEEFEKVSPQKPLFKQDVINKCKALAEGIDGINLYLINNTSATETTIKSGTAYIKALKLGGISFDVKRTRIENKLPWCYYVKMG